jgi:lysozyme family protein
MPYTFAASKVGYANLWRKAEVTSTSAAAQAAKYIIANRDKYEEAARGIGHEEIWPLVGAIHWRESGGDFGGVLHNGQHIIGTGQKTTIVPKGRGPFSTWQEAASDALKLQGWDKIDDWPLERWLYEAERYNGWGYLGKINSPYVWAGTNLQQRGKYISDGTYSSSTWDQQLGVAAILKAVFDFVPEANPDSDVAPPQPEQKPVPAPVPVPSAELLTKMAELLLPVIEQNYVVLTKEQFASLIAEIAKGK